MKADFRKCAIDECPGNSHYAAGGHLGFCRSHYERKLRHGDPLAGGPERNYKLKWLEANKTYSGDDCLIPAFPRNNKGYAIMGFRGRSTSVSRVMCILVNGEPPTPKHEAAHSCGKGHDGCVHPKHLRWATRTENHADAISHGTHTGLSHAGEAHPGAKINDETARQIRRLLADGIMPAAIARQTGTTRSIVNRIKFHGGWSHIR